MDGTVKYFIYGHHVDPQDIKLEQVLQKKEMLSDILEKFKGMNICSGLGDVNIHLLSAVWLIKITSINGEIKTVLFSRRRKDAIFA